MDKAPCTKFYGVLIRFLKVIKLSFEFNVSDVIPANVQNISPVFFFFFYVLVHSLRAYEAYEVSNE